MDGVRFIFGIHGHQPVGNLPEVFAEAYQRSYIPFLDVLSDYADVPFALHISGVLFDWFEEAHPEFLDRLGALVDRGQVELLTGGYYEPMLAAVPDVDKVGQIQRMTAYLRRRFGVTARGMWLAERVWEPHLAKPIAEAGVEYVILDDNHFRAAGLPDEALTGQFLTEEQGVTLALFPISQRLRYLIPFREPAETLDYLRQRAALIPSAVAVMADDAEKFGGWPGTHDWVYRRGWLRRFLDALRGSREWLTLTTFSQVLADPPRGRVYIPTASYAEMTEWALPPEAGAAFEEVRARVESLPDGDRIQPFVRGGFWRNFLVKYPEVNTLHKKMLRASERVHALPQRSRRRAEALQALWRGQCNDAYWHGVFGGLYLPHLRHAVYQHLIRAERAAEGARTSRNPIRLSMEDWDGDGSPEVLIEAPDLSLVVEPSHGGMLVELDVRAKAFNLGNTLTRRPEAYHRKLFRRGPALVDGAATIHEERGAKEEGLIDLLQYDPYRRGLFVDHWLPAELSLDAFLRQGAAARLARTPYAATVVRADGGPVLDLTATDRQGGATLGVHKRVQVAPDAPRVTVAYRLRPDGATGPTWFGVEINLAFYMGPPPDRTVAIDGGAARDDPSLLAVAVAETASAIRIADAWLGLAAQIELTPPARLWRFPVQTISQSESGYERVPQQICLLPAWPVGTGGEGQVLTITVSLDSWRAAAE